MMRWFLALVFASMGVPSLGQGVEWIDRQESYQTRIGQNARIPIHIRNTTDRAQSIIVRKAAGDLNANQRGYFCQGAECFDGLNELTIRLEAGETSANLTFVVEPGMAATSNSFRFEIFQKGSPQMGVEHAFLLNIDEKTPRSFVFQSRDISVHDIYPNPVTDQHAYIDYRLSDESVKAKVVIHNILGSPVAQYEMVASESRVNIQSQELSSGVYFYTVYLDNVGILTRKMVVRK